MPETREVLNPQEQIELRWMARVNALAVGMYGPSLLQIGPVPACESLVAAGYARRVDAGRVAQRGYWITPAGQRAIRHA